MIIKFAETKSKLPFLKDNLVNIILDEENKGLLSIKI